MSSLNKSFRKASYFLGAAIIIGLQSFAGIPVDYERTSPPGIAFYVWELSFIVLFIYAVLQVSKKKTLNQLLPSIQERDNDEI